MSNLPQSTELPEEFDLSAAIASVATHYDENPPDEDLLALFALDQEQSNIEQEQEEKRMRRLADCGNFSYRFDSHTGNRSRFIFNCGMFRECERCRAMRCHVESDMVQEACAHGNLRYYFGHPDDINRMLDRSNARRKNYSRFPQTDGNDLLIYDETIKDYGVGQEASWEWSHSLDWMEIIKTPEGRHISGGLHRPKVDAPTEKFAIIQTASFMSTADTKEIIEVMDKVIEETQWMKPESAKEVEEYLKERNIRALKELRGRGYEVRIYYKKEKIILSRISWGLIKGINTEKQGKLWLPPSITLSISSECLAN